MKLMYFDDYKLGVVKGDTVVDVSSVVQGIPHTGPHDLINGLIERFAEYRSRLEDAVPPRRRPPRPHNGRVRVFRQIPPRAGGRAPPRPVLCLGKCKFSPAVAAA